MTTVGVRELKAHLSEYLARARAGEVIVVTDRGTSVAQLSPVPETVEDRLRELVRSGKAEWGGGRPPKFAPLPGLKPGLSVADLVIQERDESVERFGHR